MPRIVNHFAKEYVRGTAHTNGIESFWSTLKRAHKGTFHKLSAKQFQRYVDEFVAKNNFRKPGLIDRMKKTARSLIGKELPYRELVAPNGLSRD